MEAIERSRTELERQGVPAIILSSEAGLPLKGEIAFTLPGDALRSTAPYTRFSRKLILGVNSAEISALATRVHKEDAFLASSCRHAEKTSPRRKTVENTGSTPTAQRGGAAEHGSTRPFALLGRRFR